MTALHVVILAAGFGTRMRSSKPKVLHEILGKPMLQHVLDAAYALDPASVWIVYGYEGEQIKAAISDPRLHWVEQTQLLGTGHALQQLYPHLAKHAKASDKILILFGDGPAISSSTLRNLIQHTADSLILLNVILKDPSGFGRVLRNSANAVVGIREHKDASEAELHIQEIYSGIMLVNFAILTEFLPKLTNHNSKKEFYLTELIHLCVDAGKPVEALITEDTLEASGVNDRLQLAALERGLQKRYAQQLMLQGVTLADPARFDVRGELKAEEDVFIDINCIIEGEVSIGKGSTIGAHCILKNCQIGRNVSIQPYTLIDGATIKDHASVGPFARIRPGTVIDEKAHIGNFVEVKKSHIGKNAKAGHLAYIGDTTVGEKVNIGAGTITCNYDGANKHQTTIEAGAFIGSNTSLVAPVTIGENAVIGAGSTITRNAPADQLTVARTKQTSLEGWKRPKKKETSDE